MSSSIVFKHNATKFKKIGWFDFTFFDFRTETPLAKIFLWLLGLKFHDLGRRTQRKPENIVYLSTVTIFFRGILQSCRLSLCAFKLFFFVL